MTRLSIDLRTVLTGIVVLSSSMFSIEAVLGQGQEAAESTAPELSVPLGWPREYGLGNGGKLLIYQPQLERWTDYEQLRGTLALAYTRSATDGPLLGTLILDADTDADLESNLVRVHNIELLEGTFAGLSSRDSKILTHQLKGLFPKEMVISLDNVLAALRKDKIQRQGVVFESGPPPIFVSQRPAILVQFDGEPLLSPIDGVDLQYVVNTNWDLFYLEKKSSYYLLNGHGWLQASNPEGPWRAASKLPKSFGKLAAAEDRWRDVVARIPTKQVGEDVVPEVFVSEEPAELIVIDGDPLLEPIGGTDLFWVTNTESDLFVQDPDRTYFFLVSGRWFRSDPLSGPWSFVSEDLPKDFAQIPPYHSKGGVLALVPGTPEARRAATRAQIPRKVMVDRETVSAPEVGFVGDGPEWKPIEGTSLAYAVNTGQVVIKTNDDYYLCANGVWFISAAPTGPWRLTDIVLPGIYEIPPSSPVHPVTYVQVLDSSPTTVTFGHTSGYLGDYYGWDTMIHGTGWHYPPWSARDSSHTYYYGHPFSFGSAARYDPDAGTYRRGSTFYGPASGAPSGADSLDAGASVVGTETLERVQREAAAVGGQGFLVLGANELYAGQDGQVYRRDQDGWYVYADGGWKRVEAAQDPRRASSSNKETWDRKSLSAAKQRRVFNLLEWDYKNRTRGSAQVDRIQN